MAINVPRQPIRALAAPGVQPRMPGAPSPIGEAMQRLMGGVAGVAEQGLRLAEESDIRKAMEAESKDVAVPSMLTKKGVDFAFQRRVAIKLASMTDEDWKTEVDRKTTEAPDITWPEYLQQRGDVLTENMPASARTAMIQGYIKGVMPEINRRGAESKATHFNDAEIGWAAMGDEAQLDQLTTEYSQAFPGASTKDFQAKLYTSRLKVLRGRGGVEDTRTTIDRMNTRGLGKFTVGAVEAAQEQYGVLLKDDLIYDTRTDPPNRANANIERAQIALDNGMILGPSHKSTVAAIKTELYNHTGGEVISAVAAGYTLPAIEKLAEKRFPALEDWGERSALMNLAVGPRRNKIEADIYKKVFDKTATPEDVQAEIDTGIAEGVITSEDEMTIKMRIANYQQLTAKQDNIQGILDGERMYLDPEAYENPLMDEMIRKGWANGIRAKVDGTKPVWSSVNPIYGEQAADTFIKTGLLPNAIIHSVARNADNDDPEIYIPALAEYVRLLKHPKIETMFSALTPKGRYRTTLLMDALEKDAPNWSDPNDVDQKIRRHADLLSKVQPLPYTRQQLAKLGVKGRDIFDKGDVTGAERIAAGQDGITKHAPLIYVPAWPWNRRARMAVPSPIIGLEWFESFINHVGANLSIGMTEEEAKSKAAKDASDGIFALHPPELVNGVLELTFKETTPQLQQTLSPEKQAIVKRLREIAADPNHPEQAKAQEALQQRTGVQ